MRLDSGPHALVLLACVALACTQEPSGPTCDPPRGEVSARHTQWVFDLATGQASFELELATDGACCASLACTPDPGRLQWDGEPASQTRTDDRIEICGACRCASDASVTLTGELAVPEHRIAGTDAGFTRTVDAHGDAFTRVAAWLGTCGSIGPCDDTIGLVQRFGVEVRHDAAETVLCAGVRTVAPGVTRCLIEQPAPAYAALGFIASDAWIERPLVEVDGARVTVFESPHTHALDTIDPDDVASFLRATTAALGPLPYGNELRVAVAPSVWLGYEHPANIVIADHVNGVRDYASPALHTLLHEIAHQWAGDRTTPASLADYAWKEAIAEYLVYVFEDEHRPPREAEATRRTWHRNARFAALFPRPDDADLDPALVRANAYGIAPMAMLLQLEPLIGRDAILAGVTAFLATPGGRGTRELVRAIEDAAGTSLSAYADAWIFGRGEPPLPFMSVSLTTLPSGDVEVTVTQEAPGERIAGCEVEVRVDGATRHSIAHVSFGTSPTSRVARALVTIGEPALSAEVDPDDRLADSPIPWELRPATLDRAAPVEL